MPAGKLLACEPYGPLGIIGSQGAVVFLLAVTPHDGEIELVKQRTSGRKLRTPR